MRSILRVLLVDKIPHIRITQLKSSTIRTVQVKLSCSFKWSYTLHRWYLWYDLLTRSDHKSLCHCASWVIGSCPCQRSQTNRFYKVAKNCSDIYSWRYQSRTVISIKVSWILMSGLIVVNGPLGLYYYYMISSDTKTHDIFLSPLTRYFPQFWHQNYPHRSLQGHWCQLSDSYYKNTWTLSLWKLHLVYSVTLLVCSILVKTTLFSMSWLCWES